ncbi:hypothetical protein WCT78_00155 [Pectobacterium versatile]|uniref:hypothetical protein n=1 Tax=Pectobacterium TaxID=122277 RepID=UPI000EB1A90F|nr:MULTISPECIES: hypothetical protein [Pectobacterium]MBI0472740.1 hypothetical protein [Pectobacterium parmentieri]MBI0495379.1 hypothetical protein [Pectobacterium parmentieri]MBI0569909.1 hypothetical protein [Pectobacterium parmentieri]MBI0574626.1 hypothetical protein [Pectobacterium parmentieri]MBK4824868.1 hypothetical protein [Pectobacterium carotovorum subsp. carotovorum]
MGKDGFNTNDIDSIVARCSKRRHIDESNLKHKTLETGALPSATHDAGAVVLSFIADAYNSSQRSTSEDIEWSRATDEGYRPGYNGYGYYVDGMKTHK